MFEGKPTSENKGYVICIFIMTLKINSPPLPGFTHWAHFHYDFNISLVIKTTEFLNFLQLHSHKMIPLSGK